MRLIGGKDYYDGAGGWVDQDPNRVYVRKNFHTMEPIEDDTRIPVIKGQYLATGLNRSRRYSVTSADVAPLFVVFCGTLYRGAYNVETHIDPETGNVTLKYHSFFTLDEFLAELDLQDAYLGNGEKYYNYEWYKEYVHKGNAAEYFTPRLLTDAELKPFIDGDIVQSIGFASEDRYGVNKHPIRWYDNSDGLKELGFARVVDVWQANQQIDMFVGSQLAREENRMVKLSDKDIIAKHGFDEHTFRNQQHRGKPRGQK